MDAVSRSLGENKLDNWLSDDQGVMVCGSVGEVAPDPLKDDYFEFSVGASFCAVVSFTVDFFQNGNFLLTFVSLGL